MCLRAIKTIALQLQRVPVLGILGYNIDLYFKQALQFPKPKTKGRQIWPPPRAAKGPADATGHSDRFMNMRPLSKKCFETSAKLIRHPNSSRCI